MGGAYGTHGGEEQCIWDFGGKARRKKSLGRPRHRWEVNIKVDLR
jgi:hypothetical protein